MFEAHPLLVERAKARGPAVTAASASRSLVKPPVPSPRPAALLRTLAERSSQAVAVDDEGPSAPVTFKKVRLRVRTLRSGGRTHVVVATEKGARIHAWQENGAVRAQAAMGCCSRSRGGAPAQRQGSLVEKWAAKQEELKEEMTVRLHTRVLWPWCALREQHRLAG